MKFILCGLMIAVTSLMGAAAEVPGFSLEDENSTSPRAGQAISPRDYRHQVTAWYFGAAN